MYITIISRLVLTCQFNPHLSQTEMKNSMLYSIEIPT